MPADLGHIQGEAIGVRWHAALVICAVVIALVTGCSGFDPTEVRGQFLKPGVIVDDSPAWSKDGAVVAFHRGFASSLGPPGVYVVQSAGGQPRLITAGDYNGPRWLAFSPDGHSLASIWQGQLTIIDLATGATNIPTYTGNVAASPVWSPDGRYIAYSRQFQMGTEPPDSGGVHVYDLLLGEDVPVRLDGGAVAASDLVWPGSLGALVCLAQGADGTSIFSIRPDGTQFRVVATISPGAYEDLQWYESATLPTKGPLVRKTQDTKTTVLIDGVSGAETVWPMLLGPWDALSSDGQRVVLVRPERTSGFSVLFIADARDYSGATRQPLTTRVPVEQTLVGPGSLTTVR